MKKIILLILFWSISTAAQQDDFIKGVDMSSVKHIEDIGGIYYLDGVADDPLNIFSQSGVNWIRLRLWHTPSDGYSGLSAVVEYAQKAKLAGYKFLLDIHYSDTWADPGHQYKPAAWNNLDFSTLADSVYSYTYNVIKTLNDMDVAPEMVQIGNEIVAGMLWPEGRVNGIYNTETHWQQFTTLLKRGINAVHDASTDSIRIMIHIDRGGDNSSCRWFYGKMNDYKVPYDIIGLSYYPWWHGTISNMQSNINDLAGRFGKDIIIAETAYPWTLQWFDNVGNIVGSSGDLHSGYPASVDGQQAFISDLLEIVKDVPGNLGAGIFYWEPAYIAVSPYGSPWENLAMFDFYGNALASLKAWEDVIIDTNNTVDITFRLNTSTNSDTLRPTGFVQMRGETTSGSLILPDGEELTWDDGSVIVLQSTGGDYWETTVRMVPGTEVQYKYWAGRTADKPTHLRLGWESSVMPYDSGSGNYRKFIAGDKDSVLQLEYFNSSAETRDQYWTPFEPNADSVGLLFRVNMTSAINSGRFNPDENGPVGVRGEPSTSDNQLSWSDTKLILKREDNSVNDGSFWSGIIYFSKSLAGNTQKYKFFIQNDTDNGWENNINDRTFAIPSSDTTLYWSYFDRTENVTDVREDGTELSSYTILENYPNPFNPSTTIRYSIDKPGRVQLTVLNILGQEVQVLVDAEKSPGKYEVMWNGLNDAGRQQGSGIYILKLQTNKLTIVKKALLVK